MWASSFLSGQYSRITGLVFAEGSESLHMSALLGCLCTLFVAARLLQFVLFHCPFHFAAATGGVSPALQGYKRRGPKPTYALVTGGSAGIGFGIAKALVQQGFGVLLLGPEPDKLAAAATALRAALVRDAATAERDQEHHIAREDYVQTIVMDGATVTPDEMEAVLRAAVVEPGHRVSLLVNSGGDPVPLATPPFGSLATCAAADIDATLALHARFPALLTTLLLPVLKHRGAGVDEHGFAFGTHRRSLILNVSKAGMAGLPLAVVFGATKAFTWSFSRGLARELERDPAAAHVDVLAVMLSDVPGNMPWSPDSEMVGRCTVHKAEGALRRGWREFYPDWWCHMQVIMAYLTEKDLPGPTAELVAEENRAWEVVPRRVWVVTPESKDE